MPGATSRWIQRGVLGAVCTLVIGLYAYTAQSGCMESLTLNPADTYYNLLVQGFRAGQLSLKKDVPPGLAQLADPYDPAAYDYYRDLDSGMLDLSYYKGRFYLYFGVTPALILFWPFVALTGHYLFHRQAVPIFCAISFLVSVGLLRTLWRRYFAEVSVGVVAACALALGLATGVPVLLARCDVHEVAISCGCMLTMLALRAIWRALHEPERRCRWLAAASVAYGLALGARPSLLFGAVILLVPVIQAWRERRKIWALLTAATGPIILIGLGLMLYNALRFDNPLEFGPRVQLNGAGQVARQFFGLRWLWFNFRVYFLELTRWSGLFPFVRGIAVPPLPAGHELVEAPYGVLTNIPLVWLAVAVPLAWRGRPAQARSTLCGFLAAVAVLFGICALTMSLFFAACARYEVEFLPALVFLAVVGILGLERTVIERPRWRRAVRWGWGLLLGFSVAFNLLASVKRDVETHNDIGTVLSRAGKIQEAISQYEQALRITPNDAVTHLNLGIVLEKADKVQEAIEQYEQTLRLNPNMAGAHYNLGLALTRTGRFQEAIGHGEQVLRLMPDFAEAYNNLGIALWRSGRIEQARKCYERALRIKPDLAAAHNNLGSVLFQAGNVPEAIGHWEQALRINPHWAEPHNNWGAALFRTGKIQEAIGQYEQALRLNADYAEAHNNLAVVLAQTGRTREAIGHWEQALRINPDYAEAHYNLGVALVQAGRLQEALGHYEQALRLNPNSAEAHYNLGVALVRLGRGPEAIEHWEQALRIKPDYAEAHYNLGVALEQAGRTHEAIGHYEQALRLKPDFADAPNRLARLRATQ